MVFSKNFPRVLNAGIDSAFAFGVYDVLYPVFCTSYT